MRVPYGPLRTDAVIQIPAHVESIVEAATLIASFLKRNDKTTILTGAGISTPSGIPDYRGANGTYVVNKTYRPIFFNEFRERHKSRQRYWARSYLGYPPIMSAKPNIIHETLNDMFKNGYGIITQNVDGLHESSVELHGSLHRVVCLSCHNTIHRREVQSEMTRLNPHWVPLLTATTRTNPDGDVQLGDGVQYESFRYPPCPSCLDQGKVETDTDGAWKSGHGVLKPSVVFFGESVPQENKAVSEDLINGSNGLLCIGTSLAVYSAFRFVKAVRAHGHPIAILSRGHVRDEEKWISEKLGDVRLNMSAESVLPLAWKMMHNNNGIKV